MEKMMVTIAEAAEMCSVGYHVMAKWAEGDESFPCQKIGNKRLVSVRLLHDWMDRRCQDRIGMAPVPRKDRFFLLGGKRKGIET